jgi:hypothetical protein
LSAIGSANHCRQEEEMQEKEEAQALGRVRQEEVQEEEAEVGTKNIALTLLPEQ